MGNRVIHGKDIMIDRRKLNGLLIRRGLNNKELWEKVNKSHELNIKYKAFMALLGNKSAWKSIYSRAICDALGVENERDLFDLVDIDIEKEERRREEWKEKYQK